MRITEATRTYGVEPLFALLCVSLLVNCFGAVAISSFMHDEARDILTLAAVMLGASLALWIGLFWISTSPFGVWLSSKGALAKIDLSYVIAALTFFGVCIACIICAHVSDTHRNTQIIGLAMTLEGLANVPLLLSNTRGLLKLHAAFGNLPKPVVELRTAINK